MQSLKNSIESIIKTSEEEMQSFLAKCFIKKFEEKEFISEANVPSNEVYFIQKGLVRALLIDSKGEEITSFFAGENQFISNYSSFLSQKTKSVCPTSLRKNRAHSAF